MGPKYSSNGQLTFLDLEFSTIITRSLKFARRHWKLVWIVYLIQLLLALTIGFQVYQVIDASIGNSINLEKLIEGYNHGVLQDLLNIHGGSLSPLLGQLRWFVLVYFFFSTFLHAGILSVVDRDEPDWDGFWLGGAKYFRPFLGIGVIITLFFFLWSALIWMPFLINLFNLIEGMDRERPIFWILVFLIVFWLIGVVWIFAVSVYARLHYMETQQGMFKALREGLRRTMKEFGISCRVILFFLLLIGIAYGVNFFLELSIGISSESLILVFLLIGQVIVWFKILLRIALYKGLAVVFHNEKTPI